ncbi:hypothetical protein TWF506_003996 [Arthrobotrys conoides]|uniref:Uncharacterized protein n=1 Tax=Arthrobotrys conoides TaxID=74498 RepID=A0AAN8NG73_9PEZI
MNTPILTDLEYCYWLVYHFQVIPHEEFGRCRLTRYPAGYGTAFGARSVMIWLGNFKLHQTSHTPLQIHKIFEPTLQPTKTMTAFIRISNNSSFAVRVFVSKYNGGNDDWFTLQPGASDNWSRKGGWELVAFRDGDDTTREGRYVQVNTSIIFKGFGDIEVMKS